VRNDTTVLTAVDLLPTLCAAAGIQLPESYPSDGENLLSAFKGEPVRRTRPIFWEWRGGGGAPDFWPRLAVRDGDWKLVLPDQGEHAELFNIPADRAEAKDVAKGHPEIAERLTRMARDWQATLPKQPDPACISAADRRKVRPPGKGRGK
jgi:N-acetylgalactosamine-6-sulfatase